jgi:hypothetical protein
VLTSGEKLCLVFDIDATSSTCGSSSFTSSCARMYAQARSGISGVTDEAHGGFPVRPSGRILDLSIRSCGRG